MRYKNDIGNKAAIAGIGATEFSKNSGRSELRLAVECVTEALADAGLGEADLPRMIDISMQVRRLLDPNPVEVTEMDAEWIYRGVLG